MDVYIERDALSRSLARVQGVIERRNTQPMLSHVLLRAHDGQLRLTATDTEVAYRGALEANVTTAGEVAVDGAALFQVVRSLPDSVVHLKVGANHRLELSSGRASFKLLGAPAQEYIPLPPFEATGKAVVRGEALARVVEQVSFAVAGEDVRWGLNGAHVEERVIGDERRLRFVATDGHRLALAELTFEGDFAFSSRMLVPRKALSVMRKLLDGVDAEIELHFGEGALQIIHGGQELWFRLLEGEFPDYNAVIPTDHKHLAVVRRVDLAETLRRVSILVAERARAVRFAFDDGELEVDVHNVDRGEHHEAVPIELEGAPITVGFNARYLSDVLGVIGGERIQLEMAHPLAPCLIRDPDRDDALFVVMPMRLE